MTFLSRSLFGSLSTRITWKFTSKNLSPVKVHEWSIRNGVIINLDKSFFQFFHKPKDIFHASILRSTALNSQGLTFKYLGIIFYSCFNFKRHFNLVKNKLSSVLGRLRSILKFLTWRAFFTLFKAFVIPIYDYGVDIWGAQPQLELSKLQNKINHLLFAALQPSLNRKFRRRFLKGSRSTRTSVFNHYKRLLHAKSFLNGIKILTCWGSWLGLSEKCISLHFVSCTRPLQLLPTFS